VRPRSWLGRERAGPRRDAGRGAAGDPRVAAAPAAVSVVIGSVAAWKASSTSSSACPGWTTHDSAPSASSMSVGSSLNHASDSWVAYADATRGPEE
jgi:hypothetical protein